MHVITGFRCAILLLSQVILFHNLLSSFVCYIYDIYVPVAGAIARNVCFNGFGMKSVVTGATLKLLLTYRRLALCH